MRYLLAATLALILVPLTVAQSGTNDARKAVASLSKPLDGGSALYRLFKSDEQKVRFKLVTSWIPGEKHQGMIRYKMVVSVDRPLTVDKPLTFDEPLAAVLPDPRSDESAEKLLKRVSRCSITLILYDKDEFVLRRHIVPFAGEMDEKSGRWVGLNANDTFQMDAQEYRQFMSGGWAVQHACAENN